MHFWQPVPSFRLLGHTDGRGEDTNAVAERAGAAEGRPKPADDPGLSSPLQKCPPCLLQDLQGRGRSGDSGGTAAGSHVPGICCSCLPRSQCRRSAEYFSLPLSFSLSVSLHLSVSPSVSLSLFLSVARSLYLSLFPSLFLSVSLSLPLSRWMYFTFLWIYSLRPYHPFERRISHPPPPALPYNQHRCHRHRPFTN